MPEQDRNVVGTFVGNDQVGLTVAVDVAHAQADRVVAHREAEAAVDFRTEPASGQPVVDQNLVVARIRDDQVGGSGVVEVGQFDVFGVVQSSQGKSDFTPDENRHRPRRVVGQRHLGGWDAVDEEIRLRQDRATRVRVRLELPATRLRRGRRDRRGVGGKIIGRGGGHRRQPRQELFARAANRRVPAPMIEAVDTSGVDRRRSERTAIAPDRRGAEGRRDRLDRDRGRGSGRTRESPASSPGASGFRAGRPPNFPARRGGDGRRPADGPGSTIASGALGYSSTMRLLPPCDPP